MGSLRRSRTLLCCVLLGLAWPVAAQKSGGGSRPIYCCDDAQGRPVCGDMLPAVCYGRAYREITPQGGVRRYVAAPLTAEEVAKKRAAEQAKKEQDARALVQRRLDDALLETYASLEDIDEREDRALAEIERSVEAVRMRLAELTVQRANLQKDIDFYQGREMPRDLENQLASIESETSAYRKVIETKDGEKASVRERYAQDRRRYAELIASGETRRR